jgi:hypothetical protein
VTVSDPLADSVPMPLMLTDFALLVFQVRTVDAPLAIVAG